LPIVDNIYNPVFKSYHDPLLFLDESAGQVAPDQVVQLGHVAEGEAAVPARGTASVMQVNTMVLTRKPKMCNFLDYKDYKIIYKRYASLYFITIVDKDENELIILELIQSFVEVLDKYFSNVSELDLIFNFHKTYFILDELVNCGYISESSRSTIMKELERQRELLQEEDAEENAKSRR
jgi:AP-1 complex subunit sigma 1/2